MPLILATICIVLLVACSEPQPPADEPQGDINLRSAGGRLLVHIPADVVRAANTVEIDLVDHVDRVVARIDESMPVPRTTVWFQENPDGAIPEAGVGGHTDADSGETLVYLDPEPSIGLEAALRRWLPLTLAHELHHAKRVIEATGYGSTLLEVLVTEGLADAFSLQVFDDARHPPWIEALTEAQERAFWKRARPQLSESLSSDEHDEWFLGAGDIPRWAGYTIGFSIAKRYSAQTGTAPSEAFNDAAARVLRQSGYPP